MSKGVPRNDHRRNLDGKSVREREQLAHFEPGDRVELARDTLFGDKMRIFAGTLGTVATSVAPVPGCVPVSFDGGGGVRRLVPTSRLRYLESSSPEGPAPRRADLSGGDGRRTLSTPKR